MDVKKINRIVWCILNQFNYRVGNISSGIAIISLALQ